MWKYKYDWIWELSIFFNEHSWYEIVTTFGVLFSVNLCIGEIVRLIWWRLVYLKDAPKIETHFLKHAFILTPYGILGSFLLFHLVNYIWFK
jgi:hypothetical protein